MNKNELCGLHIVSSNVNADFEQRESGELHMSYAEETAFYSLLQQGNVEAVKEMVDKYMSSGIFVGRLSDDPLMQTKYWTVCCVTLAIRYAIQGGLDEIMAYNLSDEYIRKVDKLTTPEDILNFVRHAVVELTTLVHNNLRSGCPKPVRRCLDYIDKHLNEKISLSDLACETNLSSDYLSKLFKKHIGMGVGEYITSKKLETAKTMLRRDIDQKLVAYYLGFCSQTYFITCFKKAYGITPHKYASLCADK